jgi:NTP pyrophosphatase (non-canonical NTP hydrolase)
MNIKKIQKQLSDFADERDWNQFHNPKNLAMALSVEASELVEIFQWLTPEQSEEIMGSSESEHVKEELADVMIYLIRLADKLNVDLEDAVADKIVKNGEKYPVDTSKGSTTKRTTLKEKIKGLIEL